ncbi:hypothetical protein [Williamsia sp. CHRR-6]|uniref:hypothetical protein n=1 Tax=Williamsia sp. CHRR-6 TaxID=2835871 RepID=UPI001BDA4E70|nr:hypothetical protein [Williamsia sp. CHRR-6]MBT0567399.1 hypothetical protein [Williamsia sp. CHRR-6]
MGETLVRAVTSPTKGDSVRTIFKPMIVVVMSLMVGLMTTSIANAVPGGPDVTRFDVPQSEVIELNDLAASIGSRGLPEGTVAFVTSGATGDTFPIDAAGQRLVAVAPVAPTGIIDVLRCSAAVAEFVATNVVFVAKIKRAGGIAKVVKRLIAVDSKTDLIKALKEIFEVATGFGGIVKNCL